MYLVQRTHETDRSLLDVHRLRLNEQLLMPRPRIGHVPPYACAWGFATDRLQRKESPNECMCGASCEPHIHEFDGNVLCLHDGQNDHSHCPNDQDDLAEAKFLQPIKPQEIS